MENRRLVPIDSDKIPNLFQNQKIVSISDGQLVLAGKEVYTFRKLDPIN